MQHGLGTNRWVCGVVVGTSKVNGSGDEDSGREEPAKWSGLVGVVVGVRKSDGRCKSTGYFVNWVFCDLGFGFGL